MLPACGALTGGRTWPAVPSKGGDLRRVTHRQRLRTLHGCTSVAGSAAPRRTPGLVKLQRLTIRPAPPTPEEQGDGAHYLSSTQVPYGITTCSER